MPFTVLKISKTNEDRIDVLGEFPNEREARDFAEAARNKDRRDMDDYLVEMPPSRTEKNKNH